MSQLDFKTIAIAQLHYEELGRAVKEIMANIEPERSEWDLKEGEFVNDEEHDDFNRMKRKINVKDVSTGQDFGRAQITAVLLQYPGWTILLLKCLQRQSVALQTLQGRIDPGSVRTEIFF